MKTIFQIAHILSLMFFLSGQSLLAATNVIDNFNSGTVGSWWSYKNSAASFSNRIASTPAVGGYSMKIAGITTADYWIGAAGFSLTGNLRNLTQCTAFRFVLANAEGNTSPSWGWDEFDLKIKDADGTQINYTIPRPFTSTALTGLVIQFTSIASNVEIAGTTTGMDWSNVDCIIFQIGSSTASGEAVFTVDEISVLGTLPSVTVATMALNVRIQPRTNKTWYSNGISRIIFPSDIDSSASAPDWLLSDSVLLIQYKCASNHGKILFYCDNKDGAASPQYTGDSLFGGLVGQTRTSDVIPMMWALYDERISDRTNYRSTWSNTYKLNRPLLPTGTNSSMWTNKSGPYISGYWKKMIEIGSSTYTWDGIGRYECVMIGTNESDVLASPQNAPLKGTLQQNPGVDTHGGVWTEYCGPFGGYWVNDNYKRDMSLGQDGYKDVVVYLCASFKNQPIQNYRSNRIIIELCRDP